MTVTDQIVLDALTPVDQHTAAPVGLDFLEMDETVRISMNASLFIAIVMPSVTTHRAPSPVNVDQVSMATASAAHLTLTERRRRVRDTESRFCMPPLPQVSSVPVRLSVNTCRPVTTMVRMNPRSVTPASVSVGAWTDPDWRFRALEPERAADPCVSIIMWLRPSLAPPLDLTSPH